MLPHCSEHNRLSFSLIGPAIFCSWELHTGCPQHRRTSHSPISRTSSSHTGLRPPWHTSWTYLIQINITLFPLPHWASFTFVYSWGKEQELFHDSPLLLCTHPNPSKAAISLSYSVLLCSSSAPGHCHGSSDLDSLITAAISQLSQWFHIIPPIFLYLPIFPGIQTSWHGM